MALLSNHYIKRKETTYSVIIFCLTEYSVFVFYECTTAAGIPLNDEKLEMLCGNHIYVVSRMKARHTLERHRHENHED